METETRNATLAPYQIHKYQQETIVSVDGRRKSNQNQFSLDFSYRLRHGGILCLRIKMFEIRIFEIKKLRHRKIKDKKFPIFWLKRKIHVLGTRCPKDFFLTNKLEIVPSSLD